MKTIQKIALVLLLAASAVSPAHAGVGFLHKKNNDSSTPRCDKFYGYTLAAWLSYEIHHPRIPDPLRKRREVTVCLREN